MIQKKLLGNIVKIMTAQHALLKDSLATIKANISSGTLNFSEMFEGQENFKKELFQHLELENETFYPCFLSGLKKMELPETKIDSIKLFINEMDNIAVKVMSFLTKYSTLESIETGVKEYSRDLDSLISILLMRIESEEESVY